MQEERGGGVVLSRGGGPGYVCMLEETSVHMAPIPSAGRGRGYFSSQKL